MEAHFANITNSNPHQASGCSLCCSYRTHIISRTQLGCYGMSQCCSNKGWRHLEHVSQSKERHIHQMPTRVKTSSNRRVASKTSFMPLMDLVIVAAPSPFAPSRECVKAKLHNTGLSNSVVHFMGIDYFWHIVVAAIQKPPYFNIVSCDS